MHILFLTWKDIKHPHTWWAEQVMLEYARGLIQLGHSVTWFASSFAWAIPEEEYKWIRIIRKYTNHTIWMLAWMWYKKYSKNTTIDIIIDEAWGWPLLSPLYEKKVPIYFFVHHIAENEFNIAPYPLNRVIRWCYDKMISIYKGTKTIAVSQSTKDELIQDFEFNPQKVIVIDNTTEITPIDKIPYDTRTNNILFFGRITSIKRADHAVRAFHSVLDKLPIDSELHLIGNAQDKKYVDTLKLLITQLWLNTRVKLLWYIERDAFATTLSSYKAMLVPSQKEGYGLVVIEGNAYGLPVIAYDVAWLRDSIQLGINGILVPDWDYLEMWRVILDMFANDAKYRTLCESSLAHVSTIPKWSEQVMRMENLLWI